MNDEVREMMTMGEGMERRGRGSAAGGQVAVSDEVVPVNLEQRPGKGEGVSGELFWRESAPVGGNRGQHGAGRGPRMFGEQPGAWREAELGGGYHEGRDARCPGRWEVGEEMK